MSKSEKFLRINMWISKCLLMALPLVVAVVVWVYSYSSRAFWVKNTLSR